MMTDLDGEKIVGILAIVIGFGSFALMSVNAVLRMARRQIVLTFGPDDEIDTERLTALKVSAKRLTESGVFPVRIRAHTQDV